jgi:hypothetical protein
VTYHQRQQARRKREELARIEARRASLLDLLAASDEAERERLDQLSTAHLIALSHVNPTLFGEEEA